MQTTSDKQVNYNLCFIDYTKAFDRVGHEELFRIFDLCRKYTEI